MSFCRLSLRSDDDYGAGSLVSLEEKSLTSFLRSSYNLKVLKLYADIPKSIVTAKLTAGLITGCGAAVPPLTQKDVDEASVITSQMGVEPFHAAMEKYPDFDILIAGRTYDPEPYFAWATSWVRRVMPGYEGNREKRERMEGSIMHFGKLMECGGE